MKDFSANRYLLFFFVCAYSAGCILGSSRFFVIYTILPTVVLIALLLFINRKNKYAVMGAVCMLILLFAAWCYHAVATKENSLAQFEGRQVEIIGIVAEEPTATEYGFKTILKNVHYINQNKLYKCNEKLLFYMDNEERLVFGDKLKASVRLENISKPRNFGDFDYRRYYASKGLYMKAFPEQIALLAKKQGGIIPSVLHTSKQKVRNVIFASLPQQEAAMLYGILTGSKEDIDEDTLEVFSKTGLAHILSVSGLHIGFVVLLLGFLLKPLKLKASISGGLTLGLVAFYVLMIGAPAPALRALLMFAIMLLGKAYGKKYELNTAASFAALLMLLNNPLMIHDPGFVISFVCIFSIGFFHQPINKLLHFLPGYLRSSLALSVAVWLGVTPVLVYYFNYVSVINIFLNILAVPIAFCITLGGFIGVAAGLILPYAGILVFSSSYYLIKLLYFISETMSGFSFAGFVIPSQPWYMYLLYYGACSFLIEDIWRFQPYKLKKGFALSLIAGVFLALVLKMVPSGELRVNFIDVGQGDCSLIRTSTNKVILIDGGGQETQKSSFDIGKRLTLPALLHLGVGRIDTVIVSHIHQDHLGGVLTVLEQLRVGKVLLPAFDGYGEGEFASEGYDKLLGICRQKKIPVVYVKSGDKITVGRDTVLKIMGPKEPFLKNTTSDPNNNSMVVKLEYKDFDAIFTGDIEQEGELQFLKEQLKCDVLKVAHHGSPYSSIPEFVQKASPQISIISVGKNNYGHPSKEVINRLKSIGSLIYRTDNHGAVELTTGGKAIRVRIVRE